MREFLRDLGRLVQRHARYLLILAGSIIGVLVLIAIGTAVRMKDADFCTTCHYMEPYYRHWQASTHNDVTCIKCHDYGVGSLALSTVKYWTKTYSTRPKANVADDACLKCHEKSSLSSLKEYRRGIMFDHQAHLDKPLRGENLRCTSCHNQIVQYNEEVTPSHMVVNDRSCFICHFKDAGKGEAITGCNSCHGMPKTTVQHAGFAFDHAPYLKAGVECKQCHTSIVKGDGSVPEGKCYSCHVERSRADHSREELHQIHVTTNGIDCFQCHSEVKHGNFEMVSSLEVQCENCHVRMHNAPKQLYMGIGGSDTLDIPSAHFLAQVSCTGCHTHSTPQGEVLAHQERKEAQRAACGACHGKDREPMYDNWVEGTRKTVADYGAYVSTVNAGVKRIGGSAEERAILTDALARFDNDFTLIRDGHMAHNVWYALTLMESSPKQLQTTISAITKSYQVPDIPASAKRENSCQAFCHGKTLFPETVTYAGKSLPHQMHVKDLSVGCESCHSVTEHGKTQIHKDMCDGCHENI